MPRHRFAATCHCLSHPLRLTPQTPSPSFVLYAPQLCVLVCSCFVFSCSPPIFGLYCIHLVAFISSPVYDNKHTSRRARVCASVRLCVCLCCGAIVQHLVSIAFVQIVTFAANEMTAKVTKLNAVLT